MSIQVINIGTTANDNTGDSLRAAFNKANGNFRELYNLADNSKTTTSTTTAKVIDTFSASAIKAAKYLVHITTGSNVYFTEINVLVGATTVSFIESNIISSVVTNQGVPIKPGTFSATVSNGQVNLFFTPTAAVNTIRLNRYSILE